VSDLTHIFYDLVLLSLLADRTSAERFLRLLRTRILNVPLGPDIAKRLIAMDELWGLKLLGRGADFEGWIAERERTRKAAAPQGENVPNRDKSIGG
jgi:hypothetical protein